MNQLKAAWHQQIPSQVDGNNNDYERTCNNGYTNQYVGEICLTLKINEYLNYRKRVSSRAFEQ